MESVKLTVERLKADISIPSDFKRALDSLVFVEKWELERDNYYSDKAAKLSAWATNVLATALATNRRKLHCGVGTRPPLLL